MRGALVVAAHALEEAFRRRVFVVVLVLTIAFLALYRFGAGKVFEEVESLGSEGLPGAVDETTITAATLLGLAMFGTLFLGAVLAVFLTLESVASTASKVLPFEALYQDALHRITAETGGVEEFIVQLGPPVSAVIRWSASW